MFYSESGGGFYDESINQAIPVDAIEISTDEYEALKAGLSSGKRIVCDSTGKPGLADALPPTSDELSAAANAQRDQQFALAALRIAPLQDAVDLGVATATDTANLTLWKQYRVAVNRVSTQASFPAQIDWPVQPA